MKASKSCELAGCENEIPASRLKHNSQQKYCSRECARLADAERRRANGFYQRFSQLGNATQNALAEKLGERPGHAKRSEAMKRYNMLHTRRKKQ